MRQNELATKKIHDFNKKKRFDRNYTKNRDRFERTKYEKRLKYDRDRSNYEKYKKFQSNRLSTERIDKLLKKLIKKSQTESKIFKNRFPKQFSRSCQHCNGSHWDANCPKKNSKKESKKVF